MFNWKRRPSVPQKVRLPSQSSVAEQDRLASDDLVGAQLQILGDSVRTIIDAGAHRDPTTEQYLRSFPQARVLAVEAVGDKDVAAQTGELAFGDRLELVRAILSDSAGVTQPRRNADGTTSPARTVDTVTVADLCSARGIESLDILRVDNQGDEFRALKGAETMLSRGAIRLMVLNVNFVTLDNVAPTFWYITDYLRRHGYALQGIYQWSHEARLPAVLKAAEAIFVAPQLQVVPGAPLPSAMLDAAVGTGVGVRLPDRFLCNLRLQEGALARPRSSTGGSAPVPGEPVEAGIAPIKDVIIDLQPEPYKYSVVLDTDRNIIRKFRGIGLIVMEVSVKVVAGRIGILWADENYQPLAATEHYVSAMPSVQRVLISAPFMQAHHLVIRNVADGSTGSTFKVTKASAKVVGDTVQEDGADKPDAEAIHMRALMTARAGDLNLAARLFADASALDPDNADALAGQGEMLDMTGQGAIALSKYETSRSLRAAGRGGAPDRTFALRRRGRSTTEIAAYTSVLHPEKPRALAYIARGNAFLAEGRADRALADYETAFQLKPAAPEISALKGEALAMLGCYMEALEAFDEAIAARPQDFEAMGGRAIAHLALGNLDAADADWRRQFELIPAAQTAARACVALRLADYENALAELDRTLAKEPANPYWRLYRLTALHRLGQPPGEIGEIGNNWPNRLLALHAGKLTAEQVLARADNDDRRNEALFQLAVLAASRDPGEARRLWAEVVAQARPDLIEHAAARHELARLGA